MGHPCPGELMARGTAPPCGRHWSAPSKALVSSLWAVVFPLLPEDFPGGPRPISTQRSNGFPREDARTGPVPRGCERGGGGGVCHHVLPRKGHCSPRPPSCAQGPQRWGRLAHGSAGSGHTAQLAASWEGSPGGTRAGNPIRCFLPSAHHHPRDTIFVKKVLHICSAAAGQESRCGPD